MTASSPARARTATLVVTGPASRLSEAVDVLGTDDDAGALHVVLISTLSDSPTPIPTQPGVVSIEGLRPEYVDNAIAAVRLSSLPTVVWWRGGDPEGLDRVAALADRVVLDVEDPNPLWRRAPPLFEHTALTDIRWARLTRWRGAMAHFFDLPEVREAISSLTKLTITGRDRAQCALFAGWLDSSLGWKGRVSPEFLAAGPGLPMVSAALGGDVGQLALHLMPSSTCLKAEASLSDRLLASRVISLGDQRLAAVLSEELKVRSRDVAFERALLSAGRST